MSWFSPLKGKYPSLSVLDKSAPVAADSAPIVRGSVIVLLDTGEFTLATDALAEDDKARVYIALNGSDDSQTGFAGTVGFGNASGIPTSPLNGTPTRPLGVFRTGGQAVVTGISVMEPLEYQTDQFATAIASSPAPVYTDGAYLSFGEGIVDADDGNGTVGGLIVPHIEGKAVIGRVSVTPATRYINSAPAAGSHGRRQGANVRVIGVDSMWVPRGSVGPQGPAGEAVKVSVTFDSEADTPVDPVILQISAGGNYTLPDDPVNGAKTFDGWYTATGGTGTQVTAATPLTNAMAHTLYAKWSA